MRTESELDLLKACSANNFAVIEALLKTGTNPEFHLSGYPKDYYEASNYKTPIGEIMNILSSPKHLEIIAALINAGANINGPTNHSYDVYNRTHSTPLGKAILAHLKGDPGNAEIQCKTDPAIQQKVVDYLLAQGADVHLITQNDLVKFLQNGKPKVMESLLNAGLNPNAVINGKPLLQHVIAYSPLPIRGEYDNRAELVKLLINRGANLSVIPRGTNLRHDVIDLFLQKDTENLLASMSLNDNFILEYPQLVQRLIERGDDINAFKSSGFEQLGTATPLMQAAHFGYAKAAFLLLEAGADMNLKNSKSETALHIAMSNSQSFSSFYCSYHDNPRFPILLELYSREAIPHLDSKGRTPLMRCHVTSDDFGMIRFCVSEFSKFEARYYSFDILEYDQKMFEAYKKEMKRWEAFDNLPILESPKHLFEGILSKKTAYHLRISLEEECLNVKKHLLVALKTNNEIMAASIIRPPRC